MSGLIRPIALVVVLLYLSLGISYGKNCSADSGSINPVLVANIVGAVFEDVNYGGGAGRNLAVALADGGAVVPGARVELYDVGGLFMSSTTTNASGVYTFSGLGAGVYSVRVVNNTVSSSRPGYTPGTHLAVLDVSHSCAEWSGFAVHRSGRWICS